jgi:hypothetical protein
MGNLFWSLCLFWVSLSILSKKYFHYLRDKIIFSQKKSHFTEDYAPLKKIIT